MTRGEAIEISEKLMRDTWDTLDMSTQEDTGKQMDMVSVSVTGEILAKLTLGARIAEEVSALNKELYDELVNLVALKVMRQRTEKEKEKDNS